MDSNRGRDVKEEGDIGGDVRARRSNEDEHNLNFSDLSENKGTPGAEVEKFEEGEVVNLEESKGTQRHSDLARSHAIKSAFNEEIGGGSEKCHGEHQISTHSSLETTISDCTTEETAVTNSTSIAKTNEPVSSEIFKGQSSVSVENLEQEVEYDVEEVLDKQETHDLLCPNCDSCITKTVILRRRKKVEGIWVSVDDPPVPVLLWPQEPDVVDERQPILYKCLSCFGIFICPDWLWRRGDSTETQEDRLRPPYGEYTDDLPLRQDGLPVRQDDPRGSQTPTVVILNRPGNEDAAAKKKGMISNISSEGPNLPSGPFNLVPAGKIATGQIDPDWFWRHGDGTVDQEVPRGSPYEKHVPQESRTPTFANVNRPGNEVAADTKRKRVISDIPSEGSNLPHNTFKPVPTGKTGTARTNAEKDVIISMPGSSQPNQPSPLTAPLLSAVPLSDASTVTRRVSRVGIVKAMVYGGLLESIASLSVVSSAAGSKIVTLKILALGIANLMGGLCALFHKVRVLKHETRSDEYKEAFGEPGHFWIHATVAVFSYIFFGLLPPVLYAFTFRGTDIRDYKMIVVAVSSLLSVVLLSVGKASVRSTEKRYMKTVSYYLSLAVVACGVSFVLGDLLEWFLSELGWFSSSSSSVAAA